MSPLLSSKGRSVGKLLEQYQSSTLGQGIGGGGVSSITTIADLNSEVDWTTFPDGGDINGSYNQTNYYGSRGTISGGNGRLRINSYEYSMYTKFSCRSASSRTGVFQIHDYAGTLTNFNTVKKSIEKLENLNAEITSNNSLDVMTKKETLVVKKQI